MIEHLELESGTSHPLCDDIVTESSILEAGRIIRSCFDVVWLEVSFPQTDVLMLISQCTLLRVSYGSYGSYGSRPPLRWEELTSTCRVVWRNGEF